MVSYAQLEAEQWWDREIVTTELDWLGDQLCAALGRPRSAFGSKGNNVHLNGGHRSQEWILRSIYCTNRVYTVQAGLSADQLRHISAGDFTPGAWGTVSNRQLVAAQTRRLWDEAVAGNLPGVVEIQGTLDGVVTAGINLITGNTSRPDSSHLDHWHVRMDRKRLRDLALMQNILATVLGTEGMEQMYTKQGDGMNGLPPNHNTLYLQKQLAFLAPHIVGHPDHPMTVDGRYGSNTAWWTSIILTGGYGNEVTGDWFAVLDQMVASKVVQDAGTGQGPVGPAGPQGPEGPQGPKGDQGDSATLAPGTRLEIVED